MIDKVIRNVTGCIEIHEVRNNTWRFIAAGHNLICNQAADIQAMALGAGLTLNGMYMVYRNTVGATPITPDKYNTATTYATPSANRGMTRVSTLGDPTLSVLGADYLSNRVTLVGVTDGSAFFPAVPVIDGTSVFYTAALVLMRDITDQAQDMIFSCGDLTTAITKVAGAQVGLRWTLTFTNP